MVATASASNATNVTASTRPTVSRRCAGAHIPPAGVAGADAGGALSVSELIRVRVEPQLALRSSAAPVRSMWWQQCASASWRYQRGRVGADQVPAVALPVH